jgi:flavin-dependent dehydrogenase
LIRPLRIVLADTSHLDNPLGRGWVAAGDAAMALDPLASAGISDAIKSGTDAAKAILNAASDGSHSLVEFAKALAQQYASNRVLSQLYYRMECRWPNSVFWARRQKTILHKTFVGPAP